MLTGKIFSCGLGGEGGRRGGGGGDRTNHIHVIHLDSDTRLTSLKFHDIEKKRADVCLFKLLQLLKCIKY